MSEITKQDLIEAIDDVLSARPVSKWDYLVSVMQDHPNVGFWTDRMLDLEQRYSDRANGRMLTDEGLAKLRELRLELLASHEA